MNLALLLLSLLALLGQAPAETTVPSTPEVVRVLAVQVRQVDGAARLVAPSLEPIRALLEKVPGNLFTEIGFHELQAPYGEESRVELGEGYAFSIRPVELTDLGEIVFECHIDLTDAQGTVEALRATGKATRGQGAAFRGLLLNEGEMLVIVNLAQAEEDSENGGHGDQPHEGTGEGGDTGEPGADGAGGGPQEAPEPEASPVPMLPSRAPKEEEAAPAAPTAGVSLDREDAVPPSPDRATIEGILRALEEQDMEEQKSARNRRYDVVIKGDWW